METMMIIENGFIVQPARGTLPSDPVCYQVFIPGDATMVAHCSSEDACLSRT
jgi:hypothetical protein